MSSQALLLLPKLRVNGANLISSPLTWGFPSPTAFTGLGYALQRWLQSAGEDVRIDGVAIACNAFAAQTTDSYVKSLKLTRNPLNHQGKVAAIVEQGRCEMEVSLLFKLVGQLPASDADLRAEHGLAARIRDRVGASRIAGGSVLPERMRVWSALITSDERAAELTRSAARQMLPGRVLVSRMDLLEQHHQALQQADPNASALDALLDLLALHRLPTATGAVDSKGQPTAAWHSQRRKPGWLVPLPMGYQAISDLYPAGSVRGARDPDVPFRFVESVIGLGEWLHPLRVSQLDQLLWRHAAKPEAGSYCVDNHYRPQSPIA